MFEPSEFFEFLRKPYYQLQVRKKTNFLTTALKIYFLTLLFVGLINSLNIIILSNFLTLPIDKSISIPYSLNNKLWLYIIIVVVISPICEEIIFRLPLIFKPFYVSISISTLIALIIYKISNVFFFIISFSVIFFIINKLAYAIESKLTIFWEKHFVQIFYFLSVLFGLVHISNYEFVSLSQFFISPILVLPQIMVGFILSFTRLYYEEGFLICLIIHVFMNLISVVIFFLQTARL